MGETILGVVLPVGASDAISHVDEPPVVVSVPVSTTTIDVDDSDDGLVVVQINDHTIEISQEDLSVQVASINN